VQKNAQLGRAKSGSPFNSALGLMMNAIFRLIISIVVGILATLVFPIDPNGEDYIHVFLVSVYIVTMGFFIPFSLYTSPSMNISKDKNGIDQPIYLKSFKSREKLGTWSIVITCIIIFTFMFLSSALSLSEDSYHTLDKYILSPAVWYLFIAIYFFVTKECPYCSTLNGPMTHECKKCHNNLPQHNVNIFVD